MEFILANLSITNGARFLETEGVKKLVITCHITSKIKDFPYENKFQQVDYDVNLELPQDLVPSMIEQKLPEIAQQWITSNYPTIL